VQELDPEEANFSFEDIPDNFWSNTHDDVVDAMHMQSTIQFFEEDSPSPF